MLWRCVLYILDADLYSSSLDMSCQIHYATLVMFSTEFYKTRQMIISEICWQIGVHTCFTVDLRQRNNQSRDAQWTMRWHMPNKTRLDICGAIIKSVDMRTLELNLQVLKSRITRSTIGNTFMIWLISIFNFTNVTCKWDGKAEILKSISKDSEVPEVMCIRSLRWYYRSCPTRPCTWIYNSEC